MPPFPRYLPSRPLAPPGSPSFSPPPLQHHPRRVTSMERALSTPALLPLTGIPPPPPAAHPTPQLSPLLWSRTPKRRPQEKR